jgi:hypothetical protein
LPVLVGPRSAWMVGNMEMGVALHGAFRDFLWGRERVLV